MTMTIRNKYKFEVQPEKFDPPEDLSFLHRIDRLINIAELARIAPSCPHPNTFWSRYNRTSNLKTTGVKRVFSYEIGEILNEVFWELGVGLGHFSPDPHKKYRYIYQDEDERIKDKAAGLDEFAKGKPLNLKKKSPEGQS